MQRKRKSKKPGQVTIWKNADAASVAAAYFFVDACQQSIAEHGRFVVALAGGNTPKNLYTILTTTEFSKNIPWKNVYIFLSDERFVSLDDKESNYRMIRETLLTSIPVPKKNIFPIPFKKTAAETAASYEQTIKKILKKDRRFDLMILGIGNDGHTASLFPGTDIINEKKRIVKEVWVEGRNSWRISLTVPIINKSKQIMFLVTGKEKSEILARILSKKKTKQSLPVENVKPISGQIRWVLDEAAASDLKTSVFNKVIVT